MAAETENLLGSRRSMLALACLIACATVVRLWYLRHVGGIAMGGDSPGYLRLAQSIAQGDYAEIKTLPLYFLFPGLLSIGYRLGLPIGIYAGLLQLSFSVGTVCFLAACGSRLGRGIGWVAGGIAAFYPVFLFWVPYVLSDTAFLFATAWFSWAALSVIRGATLARWAGLAMASLFFLFCRPVALLPLAVGWLFVLGNRQVAAGVWSRRQAVTRICLVALVGLLLGVGAIASSPTLQEKLKTNPTIASVFGLGVWLDTNGFDDYYRAVAAKKQYLAQFGTLTDDEQHRHSTEYAVGFVRQHPGRFLKMCFKRQVSYWFPAIYQGKWSRGHSLLDIATMLLLLVGLAALVAFGEWTAAQWLLVALAFSFSVMPMLTLVDTDARYRLPSELELLILCSAGYIVGLRALVTRGARFENHRCNPRERMTNTKLENPVRIAVVIPAFRCRDHILGVLGAIPEYVSRVFVVDDACPQGTGKLVALESRDPRVVVLTHEVNQGVGGAMVTGYRAALAERVDIVVKVDGDGQMDPREMIALLRPILAGQADYTKGNRFYSMQSLDGMPLLRKIGNAGLAFLSKACTGFWSMMDPTNGYTAIHCAALSLLELDKIDHRYFFENDVLFRLGVMRAVVVSVPMRARYGEEVSNLSIPRVLVSFPGKFLNRAAKRIGYGYFLRDFNFGSLSLSAGLPLLAFGVLHGGYHWWRALHFGIITPVGTVTLSSLTVILGIQFLIAFLLFDAQNEPKSALLRSGISVESEIREKEEVPVLRWAWLTEEPS